MKQLAMFLVFALTFHNDAFAFPAPQGRPMQETPQVNKVRTQIWRYGAAKTKQLKVTLRSGKQHKGYVSRSDETSFDLSEKNGYVSTLNYADVEKIQGAGLGRGAKIAIIVGSAVAVVALVFAIGFKRAGY